MSEGILAHFSLSSLMDPNHLGEPPPSQPVPRVRRALLGVLDGQARNHFCPSFSKVALRAFSDGLVIAADQGRSLFSHLRAQEKNEKK